MLKSMLSGSKLPSTARDPVRSPGHSGHNQSTRRLEKSMIAANWSWSRQLKLAWPPIEPPKIALSLRSISTESRSPLADAVTEPAGRLAACTANWPFADQADGLPAILTSPLLLLIAATSTFNGQRRSLQSKMPSTTPSTVLISPEA